MPDKYTLFHVIDGALETTLYHVFQPLPFSKKYPTVGIYKETKFIIPIQLLIMFRIVKYLKRVL